MRKLKHCVLGINILVLMAFLIAGNTMSAFADGGGSLSPTISGGSLDVSESGALPTLSDSLNGADQSLSISLPLKVTDATGTGNGWHITASADQLAMIDGGGVLRVLPDTITLTDVTGTGCDSSSTCTLPTNSNSTSGVSLIPNTAKVVSNAIAYNSDGTPISFYNAATRTGMGIFDLTANFSENILGNTYAGSYSGSITITSVTGPS